MVYSNLENLLIEAAKKHNYEEELNFVMELYKDDFDES